MDELNNYSEVFYNSLKSFGDIFMATIPRILGAMLVLLLGWLLARLLSRGLTRLLQFLKFDQLAEKIRATEMLRKANVTKTPAVLLGSILYWIMMLIVILTLADTLGWTAISTEISKLLSYIPQLFSAIVFFMIGIYVAGFVRDIVAGASRTLGISAGKVVSNVVYYLLFLLVLLTTLEQAGIDTSILTSNLLVIVGSVMFAAAISYGFASREVLSNILASFFSRRTVTIGQTIEIDGIRGRVIAANNLSITIRSSPTEKVVIPASELIKKHIRIIEE